MGNDKRQITICDEDVLNIQNAVAELMALVKANPFNQKDYLEIFTLRSIIERYYNASGLEYQIREVLSKNDSILPAVRVARNMMKCSLSTAKRYVESLLGDK